MDNKGIQAVYANWKTVQSRKVLQLVFEVDIAAQGAVLSALGVPNPEESKWFNISPHVEEKKLIEHHLTTEDKWKKLVQKIAILCENESFKLFLSEKFPKLSETCTATEIVRRYCGVESRKEIPQSFSSLEQWRDLYGDYELWLKDM